MRFRSNSSKKRVFTGGYVPLVKSSRQTALLWWGSLGWILTVCTLFWGVMFLNGVVTLGGVPASIVGKFFQDPTAVGAFFSRDKKQLHQRLQELGIEEEIKAYYRPQIPDEVKLDQYIHQILYNWTGYVGNNYQINPQGVLILKKSGAFRLQQELQENQ